MREYSDLLKKARDVKLDWPGSKDYLAQWIGTLSTGYRFDGLIYDLGHYGRSLDSFGRNMVLRFGDGKTRFYDPPTEQGKLEGKMQLTKFLNIVSTALRNYPNAERLLGRELTTFQEFVNTIISVNESFFYFSKERNKVRSIEQISDTEIT